jgi:3-deoxy-manno-octulosonate cytidylyltransferase (CMP-KDO synthetase)
MEKVLSFGGKAVMTSSEHASGTDRIAEVARSLNCDIIVNVQGDEPLIRAQMIDDAISVLEDSKASIGTLAKRITDPGDIFDPNVVKVVFDKSGNAFYFSRAPIPYHRDLFGTEVRKCGSAQAPGRDQFHSYELSDISASNLLMFKHIGIYSYRKDVLLELAALPPSRLESIEMLEQLRAMENGFTIKVRETQFETHGVDIPEDIERIEKCLNLSL